MALVHRSRPALYYYDQVQEVDMIVLKAAQEKFLSALQAVAGIVERRHTLPILANVLIRKTGAHDRVHDQRPRDPDPHHAPSSAATAATSRPRSARAS